MKIKCQDCGNEIAVDTKLIGSIVGSATAGFGMFAWTSFLFAGTGMAAALCTAIVAGGPALYAYKDEIIKWLIDKGYKCTECGGEHWEVIPEDTTLPIDTKVIDDVYEKEFTSPAKKMLFELENRSLKEYDLIMSLSSKINDLNIFLVNELFVIKNLNPEETNKTGRRLTQATRIKILEEHYTKDITSNLYFVNTLRNKLLHPDDYGINLKNLDENEALHILDECKMAINKMIYVHKKVLLNSEN